MRAISTDISISQGFEKIWQKLSAIRQTLAKATVLGMSLDVLFLAAMIGICNFHILTGQSGANLLFQYDKVMSGQIYRLVTHPFVHLSWYHFLLDTGAFILLYAGINEKGKLRKMLIVAICGACGLIVPLIFAPAIYTNGLCGLSGIAHGLMAFSALEMMQDKANLQSGLICLLAVVFKSVYEAATGEVLFSFLQFGLCGIPIAICHAGGVIGGILSYFIVEYANFSKPICSAKG